MQKVAAKLLMFFFVGCLSAAGCATTRPRQVQATDLSGQVQTLQTELQAKDREIQELQAQLDSTQRSLQQAPAVNVKPSASSLIRVPGVTPVDLQKALVRAGLDPGPADGRLGRKTKAAVRAFQKKQHLKADGVVGEKTWALLKSQ